MAQDEVVNKAKNYRIAKYKSDKKAAASVKIPKPGVTPTGSNSQLKSILADAPAVQAPKKEEPKDFWSGVGEALDKPVIKQIVDAISTGVYSVGNYTNYNTAPKEETVKNAAKKLAEGGSELGSVIDIIGSRGGPNAQIAGLAKGFSAGFGGNDEDVKTQADSIKNIQRQNNIDTESDASKNVQFWGGLAGDIFLDPTTYVGVGLGTAAIRGATKGSKKFKSEKALSRKEGTPLPEHIEPTRWKQAKKQANEEMGKYTQAKIDRSQFKSANRQLKKKTDADKVDYLLDNIQVLQPAVFRALVKTVDDPAVLVDKVSELPANKVDEFIQKTDPDTPDIPVGAAAAAVNTADDLVPAVDETPVNPAAAVEEPPIPSVSLSQVKPPTNAEKLYDIVGKLRTTDKTPRYSPDIVKNVAMAEKALEARKAGKATGKPDIPTTVDKIIEFDREMGGITWPYKVNGKNFSRTTDEMIAALNPSNKNYMDVYNSLDDEFKATVESTSKKALDDEAYRKLGIRDEDIPLIKQGVKVEDITDEISVGAISSIARDIRTGEIPEEALKPFYELAGTTDRAAVAKYVETATKTEDFQRAAASLDKYGSHRTGVPLPHLGTSGHGLAAVAGRGFTEDDILSAKTPANPEQSQRFLEAKYEESALKLASLPNGPELRKLADDVFKATITKQREIAGPRRSKRGASVTAENAPVQAAKFETKYNSMSAMHRITLITNNLRAMPGLKANRGKFDDAYMAVLKDVDDRLRLAGFDPHLSNMRIMGDKLVVRLAPSDVFGAMTKSQRIDLIHGNPNSKGISKEYLPSTILDMAEVLVRSATKLGPDGKVDYKALVANAVHTLQGKFDQLGRGKREIAKNLDTNTRIKNDQEILRSLDKIGKDDGVTNFAELHRAAKTVADKDAVVNLAKQDWPDEFTEIAKKRIEGVPYDIMLSFIKGMDQGKPSILSELVNTNMRNASVFGGTVAKQIGEATEEYTAKVLNALDNGTPGDFLSALVTKPPFKVAAINTDPVARQLLSENIATAAKVAATPQEMNHAKALSNHDNVAAYQKDTDLLEEVAKAPEAINTEKVFDLSIRERNKDTLWRMYGTSRYFNKRAGMDYTFDTISQSAHASAMLMTGFHGVIRGWRAKGWTSEQLKVAFNALKNDLPGDEISEELGRVMKNMFDPAKMNFLDRNSIGPEHFNKVLDSVDMDKQFRVNPAATPEDMMNSWKTWNVTHVEDFLSKMMTAMVKTAEDVSMGASFSKNFGFDAPGKGLVKIVDNSKKGEANPFLPLIDKDKYYPEYIANEIVHIGRLMTESRSFKPNTKTHTFVTKVMDPVISTLKLTQTTLKPGHHVMSIVGDTWRNNLALSTIGMLNPARQARLYAESYRILRESVGEIKELDEFARFDRIQDNVKGLAVGANPNKIDKLGNTRTAGYELYPNIGNGGKITHADIYAIMQAKGVALPQHLGGMAEDFLTDYSATVGGTGSRIVNAIDRTTQGIDRLVNPLKPKFGMKQPYSLNRFSANRDTWTRGALFLGAMRSRKFNTVDEATTYAADFVKKWSPTALDLGGFETKIMRRVIFYYTWLRGMVPRIIEGTLMRPGVALAPNKAMYNLAQANGLDLNSIGDPFPQDTMFPDWYSNKVLGPQWDAGGDLWGINPTGPLGDVLNSIGSGVKPKDFVGPDAFTKTAGTFLNMSTPWFKAPSELIQGKTLQSGAPIEDKGQYLQDMVGPFRVASRITGKDLYPAMGPDGIAMPNRTEKKYRTGMTEEETGQNAIPELVNWATGMGLTNYTSESAQNSAFYQQKEKVKEERKKNERFW